MLHPNLVRSHPTIAHPNPVEHLDGAASHPVAAALHATVALSPLHSVAPVAAPQIASSSDGSASFVVAPLSRTATPVVPPAQTVSRPVAAAFQAKLVAQARSTVGLLLPNIEHTHAYPC